MPQHMSEHQVGIFWQLIPQLEESRGAPGARPLRRGRVGVEVQKLQTEMLLAKYQRQPGKKMVFVG